MQTLSNQLLCLFQSPALFSKTKLSNLSQDRQQVQIVERENQNVSNNTIQTIFPFYFRKIIRISTSVTFEVGKRQILPRHAGARAQRIAINPPSDLDTFEPPYQRLCRALLLCFASDQLCCVCIVPITVWTILGVSRRSADGRRAMVSLCLGPE